jgi:hypothetical protein
MSALSVAVLAFHDSADVLKETLQKSRASLPSCKFYIATSSEDREIIALCQALALTCIQFTRDVMTKDGAVFNYAGIARACIAFIKNDVKRDQWILLTRPQVVLCSNLVDIDLSSLAKDSLYGCGLKEVYTREELQAYSPEVPSASEVRELVPCSEFLLAFSDPPRFDAGSMDTVSAVTRYSACFVARYMIHLKLAHLGPINADSDVRRTLGRWGHVPTTKLRIEPVHAYAIQQQEAQEQAAPVQVTQPEPPAPEPVAEPPKVEPKEEPKEEPKVEIKVEPPPKPKNRLFSILTGDDEEPSTRARSEFDGQQNVAKTPPTSVEVLPVPKVKRSIWHTVPDDA